MTEHFGFASEEWDLMQEVPLDIYLTLLQADAAVASLEEERLALTAWLDRASIACADSPWMKAVVEGADRPSAAQARGVAAVMTEKQLTDKLAELSTILDQRVAPGDARAFKRLLLTLAEHVARASGGPIPGSPRVTQAESDLLWQVRRALGI